MEQQNNDAPGAPGMAPKWTSSSKSGIGKALNPASQVTFTISHGILNEVYYPREDIACIRDMGLIVTDGEQFFSEEKRDTEHATKMLKDGTPAYHIENTCRGNRYQISKEIVADPFRNTVLQQIHFKPKQKNTPFRLYVLLAPHLNNEGENNSGWVADYKGVPMLFARNGDIALALACSADWLECSAGYVGTSDGWTDLHRHKKMEWGYCHADKGNIALTAEIDISKNTKFVLALSFGRSIEEAANHARASLLEGFDSAKKSYMKEWDGWQKTLRKVAAKNFRISAAVLRMHEAKNFPGGIIASLSIPWGESKGDNDKGGYHVVWPRDLVESAGGFLSLETKDDVSRIVNYLMSTQNADGSWPQNMWLQGEPYWTGLQMDQIALPVFLLHTCYGLKAIGKTRMQRYWPLAKKALAFLLKNGPYTQQDRWEEEGGYSPFTLATQIVGLLAGAEMANLNGEKRLAAYCRQTADIWNDNIEAQTYVTGTSLAQENEVDGYYIRINPYRDVPASQLGDRTMDLKNHRDGNGKIRIVDLVSVDALALVRFGLRAADDPKILNTIKVIDAQLKVDTPNGPCWHRYNNDGYGEQINGDPFDGTGIGRAWPLLTGERAHYEIAAGNMGNAKKLLKCMDAFAHNGLLSEQIWDSEDIPEKNLYCGKHTGSGMPLTWAHAEYLKLCASINDNKVFDMPDLTRQRYLEKGIRSNFQLWRFDSPLKTLSKGKKLRIETMAKATVVWTDDAWETKHTTKSKDSDVGKFVADIDPKNKNTGTLEFTFCWDEKGNWENKNYSVALKT